MPPEAYQTLYSPISVDMTSVETFPLIGKKGYAIIINPSRVFGLRDLGPYLQGYGQAWRDAGHSGASGLGLRLPVYVAGAAE